jgi:hypothetical protein
MRARIRRYQSRRGIKALYFDGADDYASIPYNSELSPDALTVEAMVFVNTVGIRQRIVNKYYPSNCDYSLLLYETNQFRFEMYDPVKGYIQRILSNTTVMANKWYHVVGVFDGMDYWAMHINGVKDAEQTLSHVRYHSPDEINLARYTGGAQYFNGYIVLVRIYNRPLSDSEIAKNYEHARKLEASSIRNGLVLELLPSTLDCDNLIWYDNSGNGNNASIVGARCVEI